MKVNIISSFFTLIVSFNLYSLDFAVNSLFQDNMVLQRDTRIPVWGTGENGSVVSVEIDGAKNSATVKDELWRVDMPLLKARLEPLAMTISDSGGKKIVINNILVGEIWLCAGQSNMQFSLINASNGKQAVIESEDNFLRYFKVPPCAANEPQQIEGAQWMPSCPQNSGSFSAVAYFFAKQLREKLNVPVGIIETSLGGTQIDAWMSADLIRRRFKYILDSWEIARKNLSRHYPSLREPEPVQKSKGSFSALNYLEQRYFKAPTRLFNGMVAPLCPFAVRGVVWYQGESDQGKAWEYRAKLPAMIEDWRAKFENSNMPFLVLMLPGYGSPEKGFTYELRDAQFYAMRTVKNVGLAIGVDLGDEKEVHPPNKAPVGQRLARLAMSQVYGEKIAPTGPLYKSSKIDGNKMIIEFEYADEGLEARGELSGFLIAGEDKIFHSANAKIEGATVIVESPQVPNPIAVRYAWTNTPRLTLWCKNGLPAAPFRTDDFDLKTNWRKK